MASVQEQDVLRNMILSFKVAELQQLLGFAGRNKSGNKHELQARALALVKQRSLPMQAKIRDIYKASQESQAQVARMMGPANYGLQTTSPNYRALPFGVAGIRPNHYASYQRPVGVLVPPFQQQGPVQATPGYSNLYNSFQAIPARTFHVNPGVELLNLAFYDTHAELLKPASLLAQGGNRFHEAQFRFSLTPAQATDIASNRDIQNGNKMDYLYQIQLRFCPLTSVIDKKMPDEFPPSVNVHVNSRVVQLPNPIPTNKPGVEPKRPPTPVNITPQCRLSPISDNVVGVKWATEAGKGWVVAIFLVVKLTSDDLLDRLRKKGTRKPEYTRNIIIQKLNSDDDDVATTSLKVSVTCPIGMMRMKVPCRPSTCDHLQCFDGYTFLQMNERKPTWNCPVCNKKAFYEDLFIDGYYQDILDSKDTIDEETVILEKDGTWKPIPKEDKDKSGERTESVLENSEIITPVKVKASLKKSPSLTNEEIEREEMSKEIEIFRDELIDSVLIPRFPPPLPSSDPQIPPPPPSQLEEIVVIDLD